MLLVHGKVHDAFPLLRCSDFLLCCIVVARVLCWVARWILNGLNQKSPPPSLQNILLLTYVHQCYGSYHRPGGKCKSDHSEKNNIPPHLNKTHDLSNHSCSTNTLFNFLTTSMSNSNSDACITPLII